MPLKCVICKGPLSKRFGMSGWAYGHNAEPIASGRCCDFCNCAVISARLEQLNVGKKKGGSK